MDKNSKINLDVVKQQRKLLNLSQDDVARGLGISNKTYSAIERGARGLSLIRAAELAKIIQLPLEKFLAS